MTDTPKAVVLMMCQLKVIGPDGLESKARALIYLGSSTSFVSELQHFRSPRKSSSKRIVGIGGISRDSLRGTTRLRVTRMEKGEIVLDMVTTINPPKDHC